MPEPQTLHSINLPENIPEFPFPPLPEIADRDLHKQVFTHTSLYARPKRNALLEEEEFHWDNEKLEHVGDALLGSVVTGLLHDMYPNLNPGNATIMKALLVSNSTLSQVSRRYDLPSKLMADPNAAYTLRAGQKTTANLFESYVAGAYYSYLKYGEGSAGRKRHRSETPVDPRLAMKAANGEATDGEKADKEAAVAEPAVPASAALPTRGQAMDHIESWLRPLFTPIARWVLEYMKTEQRRLDALQSERSGDGMELDALSTGASARLNEFCISKGGGMPVYTAVRAGADQWTVQCCATSKDGTKWRRYAEATRSKKKTASTVAAYKEEVRNKGAQLLSRCFDILKSQQVPTDEHYTGIFAVARAGLVQPAPAETAVGSFLAIHVMLDYRAPLLGPHYSSIGELAFKFHSNKNISIRRQIIRMLPPLAAYNTNEFETRFLHRSMELLLQGLRSKTQGDRNDAYRAMGKLACTLGQSMEPYMGTLFELLRGHLQVKGCTEIAIHLSGNDELTNYSPRALLTIPASAFNLCNELFDVLPVLSSHLPLQWCELQGRVLHMLSVTLGLQPYNPVGAPQPRTKDTVIVGLAPSPDEIKIALRMFCESDYDHIISDLVRDVVVPCFRHSRVDIRERAIATATMMLKKDIVCSQTGKHSLEVVHDILRDILTAAVADTAPSVRHAALRSLDPVFDIHLAQDTHLKCLFVAANDREAPENRMLAIALMGRLAHRNAGYVLPQMRRVYVGIVMEMDYATSPRQQEDSMRLLVTFVRAASDFVQAHALTVLGTLLRTAFRPDATPAVQAICIEGIGELARVSGQEIAPHAKVLIGFLVKMTNNPHPTLRRDAAVKALGHLASGTGAVIQPYIDHPNLLGTLFRTWREETRAGPREDVMRTIGMLGALDPKSHRELVASAQEDSHEGQLTPEVDDMALLIENDGAFDSDLVLQVVFGEIAKILRDPTYTDHYQAVEAFMIIFRTLKRRCGTCVPRIMSPFLQIIRTSKKTELYLKQLTGFITIITDIATPFLPDIFRLIEHLWDPTSDIQITLLLLLEAMVKIFNTDIVSFFAPVIPRIALMFEADINAKYLSERHLKVLIQALQLFSVMGRVMEDYVHLALPAIVRCIDMPTAPEGLRMAALQTIGELVVVVELQAYTSIIIHPMVRLLENGSEALRRKAVGTLGTLAVQMWEEYVIFWRMIDKVLVQHQIPHAAYSTIITKLLNKDRIHGYYTPSRNPTEEPAVDNNARLPGSLPVRETVIRTAWNCTRLQEGTVVTDADWMAWIIGVTHEMIRESSHWAIRAVRSLALSSNTFTVAMFNVACASCWMGISEECKGAIWYSIHAALIAETTPAAVSRILFGVIQFLDDAEVDIPIHNDALGAAAMRHQFWSLALRYKEISYIHDVTARITSDLIGVNQKLQQGDSAWGILQTSRARLGLEREAMLDADEITHGMVVCLAKLGRWDQALQLVQTRWDTHPLNQQERVSPVAAEASWVLGKWESMKGYVEVMRQDPGERALYKAILAVHQERIPVALQQIGKARQRLGEHFRQMRLESYGRAYPFVANLQRLSELEEVTQYASLAGHPAKQKGQRETWNKRLQGCPEDVGIWQDVLRVRSLVLSRSEQCNSWRKMCDIATQAKDFRVAADALDGLVLPALRATDDPHTDAAIMLSAFQLEFEKGLNRGTMQARAEGVAMLRAYTANFMSRLGIVTNPRLGQVTIPQQWLISPVLKIIAQAHLYMAQWEAVCSTDSQVLDQIIHDLQLATVFDPLFHEAWHCLATSMRVFINSLAQDALNGGPGLVPNDLPRYFVPAVGAFFESIALTRKSTLQDTLQVLSLVISYGYDEGVMQVAEGGVEKVSVDVWLEVIPQIIARISTPRAPARAFITGLLSKISQTHPHALIYPLAVAASSSVESRQAAAQNLRDKMRVHSPTMVDESEMVSSELVRTASTWPELCHQTIDEAAVLLFREIKVAESVVKMKLHALLHKGPETKLEAAFLAVHGTSLARALRRIELFETTGQHARLDEAWQRYYVKIHSKLAQELPTMNLLLLADVSPRLLAARDLQLAVPGTYQSGKPVVTIKSFHHTVVVLGSKQKPRKMSLTGSDGNIHFLSERQ
ncbi:hypothetical protein IAT38_003781 [Cryptococcus sp. DSM 104549]